jgi:hypothetical protein
MNGIAIFGDQLLRAGGFLQRVLAPAIFDWMPIMNAILPTLQITIGLTALIALVAVRRSAKDRANRQSSGDSSWSGDAGYDGGDSGHHHGGGDHAGSDHSGGGDGGGGDGGGGGD